MSPAIIAAVSDRRIRTKELGRLRDAVESTPKILKFSLGLGISVLESLLSEKAIILETLMTQTSYPAIDFSQLDLSDWRKRIHQLKQELRDNAPKQNSLLPTQPLIYGAQPSSRAAAQGN